MRLLIAECSVDYSGRLAAHLPPATRLIMVKADDALGMQDRRDGADKVMRTNFPQSKYLHGRAQKDVPWWRLWDPNW